MFSRLEPVGTRCSAPRHRATSDWGLDVEENAYEHLLAVAGRLLGAPLPPVRRRWAGVYSQVTGTGLYHRSEVAPGVILVTGPGAGA